MRIEVIPQAPARDGGSAFDPTSGILLAAAEDIERLAVLSRAAESRAAAANQWPAAAAPAAAALHELEAAGAVVAGRPHPALRGALRAIAAPRRRLVVERGDGIGRAWIGAAAAALALPADEGRLMLATVARERAAEAIAAACGLDSSRPAATGDPIRLGAAELARRIAGPALTVPGLAAPITAHWRVVAADRRPPTAIEVLDTEAGAYALVPDGAQVELRPVSGPAILAILREDCG
jgi:EspG family